MLGVASLLDQQHEDRVESIWQEIKEHWGVDGVGLVPIPHFSYHVATGYDLPHLRRSLQALAAKIPPFTVRTNGLGIFTGIRPVLYIPVLSDPYLVKLQAQLWTPINAWAHAAQHYYEPANWRPHITLTQGGVDHDTLPKIIKVLSRRDFHWEIAVTNLAIIGNNDMAQNFPNGLLERIPLSGP